MSLVFGPPAHYRLRGPQKAQMAQRCSSCHRHRLTFASTTARLPPLKSAHLYGSRAGSRAGYIPTTFPLWGWRRWSAPAPRSSWPGPILLQARYLWCCACSSTGSVTASMARSPRPRPTAAALRLYVDHVIDLAGTALLFAGLAVSGYMSVTIATLVVAAFFLVSAETYLATHARGVFKMSFMGVGPTELRILLAAGRSRSSPPRP